MFIDNPPMIPGRQRVKLLFVIGSDGEVLIKERCVVVSGLEPVDVLALSRHAENVVVVGDHQLWGN